MVMITTSNKAFKISFQRGGEMQLISNQHITPLLCFFKIHRMKFPSLSPCKQNSECAKCSGAKGLQTGNDRATVLKQQLLNKGQQTPLGCFWDSKCSWQGAAVRLCSRDWMQDAHMKYCLRHSATYFYPGSSH